MWVIDPACRLTADLRHRSASVSSGTQYDGSVSAGHFGGAGSYRDISFDAAMEDGINEARLQGAASSNIHSLQKPEALPRQRL